MAVAMVFPSSSERQLAMLATAELWAQGGYASLRSDAIAARAGVDVPAFTAMFPDVTSAARATLELPIGEMVNLVAKQFAPDRSEPESCAMGIVAILRLMEANPAYACVVYVGRKEGPVPASVNSVATTTGGFMVAMLERLRDSSEVGAQPVGAGLGALGSAEAVVRQEVLAGRADRLGLIAPTVVYGATVPFVGQSEALRLTRLSR